MEERPFFVSSRNPWLLLWLLTSGPLRPKIVAYEKLTDLGVQPLMLQVSAGSPLTCRWATTVPMKPTEGRTSHSSQPPEHSPLGLNQYSPGHWMEIGNNWMGRAISG
jgi:hypothetical protein